MDDADLPPADAAQPPTIPDVGGDDFFLTWREEEEPPSSESPLAAVASTPDAPPTTQPLSVETGTEAAADLPPADAAQPPTVPEVGDDDSFATLEEEPSSSEPPPAPVTSTLGVPPIKPCSAIDAEQYVKLLYEMLDQDGLGLGQPASGSEVKRRTVCSGIKTLQKASSQHSVCLTLRDELGTLVGVAAALIVPSRRTTSVQLHSLFVLSDYRGGLACPLLLREVASAQPCDRGQGQPFLLELPFLNTLWQQLGGDTTATTTVDQQVFISRVDDVLKARAQASPSDTPQQRRVSCIWPYLASIGQQPLQPTPQLPVESDSPVVVDQLGSEVGSVSSALQAMSVNEVEVVSVDAHSERSVLGAPPDLATSSSAPFRQLPPAEGFAILKWPDESTQALRLCTDAQQLASSLLTFGFGVVDATSVLDVLRERLPTLKWTDADSRSLFNRILPDGQACTTVASVPSRNFPRRRQSTVGGDWTSQGAELVAQLLERFSLSMVVETVSLLHFSAPSADEILSEVPGTLGQPWHADESPPGSLSGTGQELEYLSLFFAVNSCNCLGVRPELPDSAATQVRALLAHPPGTMVVLRGDADHCGWWSRVDSTRLFAQARAPSAARQDENEIYLDRDPAVRNTRNDLLRREHRHQHKTEHFGRAQPADNAS